MSRQILSPIVAIHLFNNFCKALVTSDTWGNVSLFSTSFSVYQCYGFRENEVPFRLYVVS